MNSLFVFAFVTGCVGLALACFKTIQGGPVLGPPYSAGGRFILLALVFLATYSALEALSDRSPEPPGAALMIFGTGCFSCWRVFNPAWRQFLERHRIVRSHPITN